MPDDLERLEGVGESSDRSPELVIYDEQRAQLEQFRERYDSPSRLAYPGSSTDVTPSEVFVETDVVYIDVDSDAMEKLADEGYNAVIADGNTFATDRAFDAVFLYNQGFGPVTGFVDRNLAPSGVVICNEYHDAASELLEAEDYNLEVRIPTSQGHEFDTNPRRCFERIETDDQFKEFRPDQYEHNRGLVDEYVGKEVGVLEGMPEVAEELSDKPMMDAMQESHTRLQMITDMFARPEEWVPPVRKSRLPDDLFVFRRR